MKTFSFQHEFNCDVKTFWQVFFDERVNHDGFVQALNFASWEQLEYEESAASIWRVIRAKPPLDRLPAPLARMMGGGMTYTESGTFDRASGVFKFTSTPSLMADRISLGGEIRVTQLTGSHLTRTVDMFVDARLVGIGTLLEEAAIKDTAINFEGLAVHQNRCAQAWPRMLTAASQL